MEKWRVRTGIALTLVYLLGVGILLALRWPDLRLLKLNELGDVAAGAAGPVAFLWLVLGYFQQGEELAHNTKALEEQAIELRASVDAQKTLAATTQAQHDLQVSEIKEAKHNAVMKAQPRFLLTTSAISWQPSAIAFVLQIRNFGSGCSGLTLGDESGVLQISPAHHIAVAYDDGCSSNVRAVASCPHSGEVKFSYTDADGHAQFQYSRFRIFATGEPGSINYTAVFEDPHFSTTAAFYVTPP